MTLEATIADVVKSILIAELQPLINQQKSNRILPEAEVLEMLGISSQTLRRMRADGLKAYKPYGSKTYYFEKDIENYIKHKGRAV